MKRVIILSVLVVAFVMLSAPSCNDEEAIRLNEEERILALRDSIREEFETGYLTESSLMAYEASATLKLSDLSDYLHILTDSSSEESFRQIAEKQILSLFIEDTVSLKILPGEERRKMTVRQLIEGGKDNKLLTSVVFDSITVYEPLKRKNPLSYSGILSFVQRYADYSSATSHLISVNRKIEFFLVKEEKVFGTDTYEIWNVRLGGMN